MIVHIIIIIITVIKFKGRPWDKVEMAYERIKMVVPVPSGNTRGEAMKVERDNQTRELRTALVVQWVRICQPMQGTQVWFLVQEDSVGCTEPLCVCVPQPLSPWAAATEVPTPGACALQQVKLHTEARAAHSLKLEKAWVQQQRSSAAKNKKPESCGVKKTHTR